MSTVPDIRLPREFDGTGVSHSWHRALNGYDHAHVPLVREGAGFDPASDGKTFMYQAKDVADEVPRMAYLFARERRGELTRMHRQCSHSAAEPVPDNHLTCCLGVACRACPHLAALDAVDCTEEQRDVMKAWTCATHILLRGGDSAREGYLLTTDDRMYWDRVYRSMGADFGEDDR